MEIRNYLSILWRRKWVILLTIAITMAVVVIGTRLITPVYEATTVLRIASSSGGALNYQEFLYADRLMNTYVTMTTRAPVVEELMKRLGLNHLPTITAEIVPNTELMQITVEDTDPEVAATAANTIAEILISQGNQLYVGGEKRLSDVLNEQLTQIQADLDETRQEYEVLIIQTPPAADEIDTTKQLLQLKQSNYATLLAQYQQARFREEIQGSMITVFETATIPQSPLRPRVTLNIVLGLVLGIFAGLGLALLFENVDTTLYTTENIETLTKSTALARIPKANKNRVLISSNDFSPMAEAFRNLATHIQQSNSWPSAKVILILGAEPNQGKSLITAWLSFALAESGRKVVAVDCDLRLPKLHTFFGLSNKSGLSDILGRKVELKTALQKSPYEDMTILASGPRPSHTSKLLASPQMSDLIHTLRQKYDYVLLDTPALLGLADVAALMKKADGFLWVVRRAHAKREAVEAAGQFLAGFSDLSTGLIVNQADDYASYGYYGYQKESEVSAEPSRKEVITDRKITT